MHDLENNFINSFKRFMMTKTSNTRDIKIIIRNEGISTRNENITPFVSFCATNNLVIGGSTFPHKDIHKATWARNKYFNQIDYKVIDRRFKKWLLNVKAMIQGQIIHRQKKKNKDLVITFSGGQNLVN